MKLHPIRHEDHRRVLTEYISDIPFKRAKVIQSKGRVTVGNHYHENNDSVFYLLKGKALMVLKDTAIRGKLLKREWMFEGDCQFVPRGVIHTFTLLEGTIMLETASEPYDAKDEIQVIE